MMSDLIPAVVLVSAGRAILGGIFARTLRRFCRKHLFEIFAVGSFAGIFIRTLAFGAALLLDAAVVRDGKFR